MLDFLDTKKKLPGERKPVFPDGVPGLEQGVPKELYKGAHQDQLDQQNADAAAARRRRAAAGTGEGQASCEGKGKPAVGNAPAAAPAAEPDAAPGEEGAPAAVPPAPKPKKIVRKRTTAPPRRSAGGSRPPPAPARTAVRVPRAAAERQLLALDLSADN